MTEQAFTKTNNGFRIIRIDGVCNRLQLSRSWIYQQIALDQFPRPISLGARAVGWIESEVDDWLEQRITQSRNHIGG